MVSDVTRYVPAPAQRELWARAAGRCQFDGHNRLLYSSCVTQEAVNVAQKPISMPFRKKGREDAALTRTILIDSMMSAI